MATITKAKALEILRSKPSSFVSFETQTKATLFNKGKGENAATKTAKKQGFTVTKGETEMPADSKVKDYKSLWNKKKKRKVFFLHLQKYFEL